MSGTEFDRNWNLNSLDAERRREAVRTLAISRGRVSEFQRNLHNVRETFAELFGRVARLEINGASPHDAADCLNTFALHYKLVEKYADQLTIATSSKEGLSFGEITCTLADTPENAAFSKRVLASSQKLQARVDVVLAEGIKWGTELAALVSRIRNLKTWHKMTGVEFENFIINHLRQQGFSAQATKASGDEGIDILAVWQGNTSDGESLISNLAHGRKYLIQCKRYDAEQAIGQPLLRDFYGSMKGTDATAEGIFITTTRFTDSAVEYANRMGIHLIDGPTLDKILSHSI